VWNNLAFLQRMQGLSNVALLSFNVLVHSHHSSFQLTVSHHNPWRAHGKASQRSNTKGPFHISLMFMGFNLVTIVSIIELFICATVRVSGSIARMQDIGISIPQQPAVASSTLQAAVFALPMLAFVQCSMPSLMIMGSQWPKPMPKAQLWQ